MRDRSKTIASLRRLAERPGTAHEGDTARRLLEQLGAKPWTARPFDPREFPTGTRVFYCYWSYENTPGQIVSDKIKHKGSDAWMRIKFDYLKQPRWVPVTSPLGCHLSLNPFPQPEAGVLYHMDLEWEEKHREFMQKLRSLTERETERIFINGR